jgi:hypothetical protein
VFVKDIAVMPKARRMLEQGFSPREVGAELGIPATTVGRWARGECRSFGPRVRPTPWRPPHAAVYAYLLGIYLGDGHVTVGRSGRSVLRISLDGAYPGVVDECDLAIGITSLGRRVSTLRAPDSNVRVLQCAWKRWPEVFPQHGPGPKHERPIVLESWQREIVDEHPGAFVRGLIHSDGCRTLNRFRVALPSGRVAEYAYPRYFFSNLSADIRALFCDACDALGVRWTQPGARNISVSRRASVELLEALVGPKT